MSANGAASSPAVGGILDGRYRLDAPLGEGGLGVVWRGFHLRLGRPVAIKLMQPEHLGRENLVARFEREARSLAALTHPNIVGVIDFGVEGDAPYLVMELLEGRSLDRAIAEGIAPARALAIGRDVLRALSHAHSVGIAHRDLKPANVFLQRIADGSELVRVLDFGLAKFMEEPREDAVLTRAGTILGTPAYMAPEQATGGPADGRADVYSCGILLFELITGRRPFTGDPQELARQHLLVPMPSIASVRPDLDVAPELETILARATEKSPSRRYPSATELMQAVFALPPTSVGYREGMAPPARTPDAEAASPGIDPTAATAPGAPLATHPVRVAAAPPVGATVALPRNPVAPAPDAPEPVGPRDVATKAFAVRPPRDAAGSGVTGAPSGAGPEESAPTPLVQTPPSPHPLRRAFVLLTAAILTGAGAGAAGIALWLQRNDAPSALPVAPVASAPAPMATAPMVPAAVTPPPITPTPIATTTGTTQPATSPTEPVRAPGGTAATAVPSGDDGPVFAPDPDPWATPAPPALESLRARVLAGRPLTPDHRRLLQRHLRGDDLRPWLVLAHGGLNEGARSDACRFYEQALRIDVPRTRGDAHVLPNLVRLAAHRASTEHASALLARHWGARALPTLEAALASAEYDRDPDARTRLVRLRDRLTARMPSAR